jgi:glycosyltransferase involved in cell wall biosynthesis
MARNLLFIDQFAYLGGAQKVLLETLKSLDPSQFQYRVALNGSGPFREALLNIGVQVLDLPLGNYNSARKRLSDVLRFGFRTLLCILYLARYTRRWQCDLFYANGPRTFVSAALAGRLLRKRVIWHLHNVLTTEAEIRLLLFFSSWVSKIIVCSHAVAAPLLASDPQLGPKIRVLYNPHPDWDWAPPGSQLSRLREEHGWGEKNFTFGILGRITPFKGQKEFLKAAANVVEQIPEARFFVIGSPVPGDTTGMAYQAELEGLVRNTALDKCAFFLPHQSSVRECIESLDAMVNASIGPEALPQSLVEAMFLSKPVIAPAQGGSLEMIEDSVTGLLYRPDDDAALARKMVDLARSPELAMELGLRARAKAVEQFSRARFQHAMTEELACCLGEP